jgi:WD40 repeat protein
LKIWDTQTGAELLTIPGQTDAGTVAFSPDGKHVAADNRDIVRIWDATTGQEGLPLRGHTDGVSCVVYSPDGRFLATASADGTAKLWDPATGREIRTIRGDNGPLRGLALTKDGRRLATGSSAGFITIWDPTTGQDPFTFGQHVRHFLLAVSVDGKRLASASADGAVKLWDPRTGQELLTLRGHYSALANMEFHRDGKRLATCGLGDSTVKLWDVTTGQLLRTVNPKAGVFCVTFGPAVDPRACVGPFRVEQDGELVIWSLDPDHKPLLVNLSISPDGQRVFRTFGNPLIWDARTGQELFRVRGHTEDVYGFALGPDGRRAASCSDDRTVKIWDLATGEELLTLRGHTREVIRAVFSHEGRRLITTGNDRAMRLWDVAAGQEVLTIRGGGWPIIFSPDNQWIAGYGAGVQLWEATPPTPELRLQREAAALVNGLATEPLLKEEMVERLRTDRTLGEELRQQALLLVGRYTEDPHRFYEASWAVVQKPGAAVDRYQKALGQAQTACRLASAEGPSYRRYVNTLGVAQYRAGQDAEALASLTKAGTLLSARSEVGEPSNLAFLALAQHRLGDKAEAQAVLARLRAIMKSPRLANKDAQAQLREAEALIEGKAPDPKK